MIKPFTYPQLYEGAKEWYVFYHFRNPATGKMQRFKERFDINRIKSVGDRRIYGQELVEYLKEVLDQGFNPFTETQAADFTIGDIKTQLTALVEKLCIDAPRSGPKTYKQVRDRFFRYLDLANKTGMSMLQVNIDLAKAFQKDMRAQKLSSKTINNTISHLGLFWDQAMEERLVRENPFRSITPVKKVVRPDTYEPLTRDELKNVFAKFNSENRGFARFLAMIFYSWARPVEITRLQVEDIDLANNSITFNADKTKNDKGAIVQIVPPLKSFLEEMKLKDYPGKYYLFSGRAFLPGKVQKDSNKLGEKWRLEVQDDESGLGIKKKMYALKHTGNIHYLLNNKGNHDLKWQQMQNRHKTAAMTERYNRSLGAYFIELEGVKFTAVT